MNSAPPLGHGEGQDKKRKEAASMVIYAGWTPEVEESDKEEDEDIALLAMEELEDEENTEREVSPLDLKDKLDSFSKKKLVSLLVKMMDSYNCLNEGKEQLLSALTSLKFEYLELESTMKRLESENSSLQDQVNRLGSPVCSAQPETLSLPKDNFGKQAGAYDKSEEELKKTKESLQLERDRLEKVSADLAKGDLEQAKRCMTSQMIVTHFGSKTENCKAGIGYVKTTSNHAHLCTSCGKIGHTKENCPKAQICQEKNRMYSLRNEGPHKSRRNPAKKSSSHTRRHTHEVLRPWSKINYSPKGRPAHPTRSANLLPPPVHRSNIGCLPPWARRNLIHPLDNYKGPKLMWVPKTQL